MQLTVDLTFKEQLRVVYTLAVYYCFCLSRNYFSNTCMFTSL